MFYSRVSFLLYLEILINFAHKKRVIAVAITLFQFINFSSGNWTRTSDLRVMSPTSYLLLYPAIYRCKGTTFFLITKIKNHFYFIFYNYLKNRALPKKNSLAMLLYQSKNLTLLLLIWPNYVADLHCSLA